MQQWHLVARCSQGLLLCIRLLLRLLRRVEGFCSWFLMFAFYAVTMRNDRLNVRAYINAVSAKMF